MIICVGIFPWRKFNKLMTGWWWLSSIKSSAWWRTCYFKTSGSSAWHQGWSNAATYGFRTVASAWLKWSVARSSVSVVAVWPEADLRFGGVHPVLEAQAGTVISAACIWACPTVWIWLIQMLMWSIIILTISKNNFIKRRKCRLDEEISDLNKKNTKNSNFFCLPLEAFFSIPTKVSSKLFDDDRWNNKVIITSLIKDLVWWSFQWATFVHYMIA